MTSSHIFRSSPVDILRPRPCFLSSHETGGSQGIFMEGPFPQGPESPTFRKVPDSVPPSSARSHPVSIFSKPDDVITDPNLPSVANASLRASPSSFMERSRHLSPHLTSAASNPDQRGEGEQPKNSTHHSTLQTAREALGAVMEANRDESENVDAPSTGAASHPTESKSLHRSTEDERTEQRQKQQQQHRASPTALPDAYGNGDNPGTLMNSATVASPGPIEEDNPLEEGSHRREEESVLEDSNSKAFSYPVPMPSPNLNDPRRGMSLPHSGLSKAGPRSPSAKKHRCPYCSTEFTRHHNLKSHLLTHSQEKPYVCQTCQSRFRRLHDLKRHTKLHTGERPHICPKCGRRFARGDALARHNKGSGGCAGRRSSMGGFGVEEEYPEQGGTSGVVQADDAMEGLMYTEPERMDEEEERRLSIPSIRKDNVTPEPHSQTSASRHVSFTSHQSSTYPPLGGNRSPGGLFPPVASHAGSASPSPISPSYPPGSSGSSSFNPAHQGSSPSIFVQTTMTESPKPLSPSALSPHQLSHGHETNTLPPPSQPQQQLTPGHSPNLKPQFQQGQSPYNRSRQGSGASLGVPSMTAPGPLSLPSPQPGTPHLPPPPGLNPPDSRFTLHSQSQGSVSSIHSVNNRTDPHMQQARSPHTTSTTDMNNPDSNNINTNIFSQQRQSSLPGVSNLSVNDRIWDYVRSLETRMNGLEAEVGRLREQLASTGGNTSASGANGA
ncbi:C2H2 type zinc finger containing protein [Coccidioides posadasii C735 delta SOWgp]|uniref:C2H2 type zinc finger containing protein n=1 Tax=Coccidioides posadasii (strain C735) TaxID=222929 RepID=C5PBI4_COCP7|nr:C2H2 type zinc finger containing protein [Coccidioides posadasii C735 delta SOWgp]EER25968.1 C2H2 type zinc finger containing protein [Coccidioides posadasii C735 delta SOWgp]|eukprot:XP_003068113.1 C2H2 type zinc finger containing protein [Coccidioides posadasii C735 delta SOWgp]